MTATLVLLRHGESEWNAKNLFTGWVDVGLSEKGMAEATHAGQLLAEAGLRPDVVHTSLLRRAIRTAELALDAADLAWLPVQRSWRLNERHYGALQGLDKAATREKYGDDQFMRWRRSYDEPPPPLDDDSEWSQAGDPRYATCWRSCPAPSAWPTWCTGCCRTGTTRWCRTCGWAASVLVVAHGNSLRALVKHLDGLTDEEVVGLNIPTGVPLRYELDEQMRAGNGRRGVPGPGRRRRVDRGREEPGPVAGRWPTTATGSSRRTWPGWTGSRPALPMSFAELARRAEEALSPELWSYVAGGAGDERTQDGNVAAFDRWGLMPRMLVGARSGTSRCSCSGASCRRRCCWRRSA